MKRKAIIIANAADDLSGVDTDLNNIQSFLKSTSGGVWYSEEISVYRNPSLSVMLKELIRIRGRYDFLIVFFSGHGGRTSTETAICLNDNDELLLESQLSGLSARQINIFDCCRTRISDVMLESAFSKSAVMGLEHFTDGMLDPLSARELYEKRIADAAPQQISLYSCSQDEYSLDTARGGLYLKEFIEQASDFTDNSAQFQTALLCQGLISDRVARKSARQNNPQHPDHVAPKLISSQQLVISINPVKYVHGL